jgi:hypothetical protein
MRRSQWLRSHVSPSGGLADFEDAMILKAFGDVPEEFGCSR